MQNNKGNKDNICVEGLIRELLGLDPKILTFMDPMATFVAVALHEFMRATIELSLEMAGAPANAKFQFLPDTFSSKPLRRLGWPDAKTYNLSVLLAHAIVTAPRRARGLTYLPLCMADPNVITLPRKASMGERAPMAGLVASVIDLLEIASNATDAGMEQVILVRQQIELRLGLSTSVLVRPYYENENEKEAQKAVGENTQAQAVNGLATLLTTVFHTYQRVIAQDDLHNAAIRLLITDDVRSTDVTNARCSNIVNLLLGALLAEDGRDLGFLT